MLPEFALRPSLENGAHVVQVVGELDIGTAPRLREQVMALINAGSTDVILDLGKLTFIDSSGLSVIVVALKRLRERGGNLLLRSIPAQAQQVLEISGLSRVVPTG